MKLTRIYPTIDRLAADLRFRWLLRATCWGLYNWRSRASCGFSENKPQMPQAWRRYSRSIAGWVVPQRSVNKLNEVLLIIPESKDNGWECSAISIGKITAACLEAKLEPSSQLLNSLVTCMSNSGIVGFVGPSSDDCCCQGFWETARQGAKEMEHLTFSENIVFGRSKPFKREPRLREI